MFWFKKKLNLENTPTLMTTLVNKNIKLDTIVMIPNGFVGLFYYSDKYLFSLNSGEYKLQGELFNKIFEKNSYRNKGVKKPRYNFNIHFISASEHTSNISISCFLAFKRKEDYTINAKYIITEPTKFAKEILSTWYKTTDDRTNKLVNEMFKDFGTIILKKKFKSKENIQNEILTSAINHFKKYGIKIFDFCISKTSYSSFFDQSSQETYKSKVDDTPTQTLSNLTTLTNNKVRYCPHCQSKLFDGADYCHICGYQINQILK